jgi:flagellar hook-basal body complex protein FliE
MRIEPVTSQPNQHLDSITRASAPALSGRSPVRGEAAAFSDLLQSAVTSVASLEHAADQAAARVATGDLAHLHEAVIALQEVSLALDLVVEVRTPVVAGVPELLRTQA